jgi:hypothetical protein
MTDLRKIGYEGGEWIKLSQNGVGYDHNLRVLSSIDCLRKTEVMDVEL